jgi:hypothetical protein
MESTQDPRSGFFTPTLAATLLILSGTYLLGKRVAGVDTRLRVVEQAQHDHEERRTRREWLITKGIPSVAAFMTIITAALAIGITTGTFK